MKSGQKKTEQPSGELPGHPPLSRKLRRALLAFTIFCGLLLLADFLVQRHPVHPLEYGWGFYGFFGFLACVALVEIAKVMRRVLMRPPDYYEKKD